MREGKWALCADVIIKQFPYELFGKQERLKTGDVICFPEQLEAAKHRELELLAVIKEFINRAHETKSLLAASMHERRELSEYEKEINDINDLIAKSEHHNSRALEKRLLETRIDELKSYAKNGFFIANRLSMLQIKLAELNKE